MNYRDIQAGSIFQAWGSFSSPTLSEPVTLSITTKCPEKWLLIDRETGQVYQGSDEVNPHMPSQMLWKPIESN
jgi:hypothetical protein